MYRFLYRSHSVHSGTPVAEWTTSSPRDGETPRCTPRVPPRYCAPEPIGRPSRSYAVHSVMSGRTAVDRESCSANDTLTLSSSPIEDA